MDEASQKVATVLVGAEKVLDRRTKEGIASARLQRVERRQQRGEHRRDREQDQVAEGRNQSGAAAREAERLFQAQSAEQRAQG